MYVTQTINAMAGLEVPACLPDPLEESTAAASQQPGGNEATTTATTRTSADGTRHPLPLWVDVAQAQQTDVAFRRGLLSSDDWADIHSSVAEILKEETALKNNIANDIYDGKECMLLNKISPVTGMVHMPRTIAKILRFARDAAREQGWTAEGGPLESCGDVESFRVRTAERWCYKLGGGLTNQAHFDHGSLMTLVSALDDGYEGGIFRTGLDEDGTTREHRMKPGDCICFLSHKYHNVTPIVSGVRHSLVIEIWEGNPDLRDERLGAPDRVAHLPPSPACSSTAEVGGEHTYNAEGVTAAVETSTRRLASPSLASPPSPPITHPRACSPFLRFAGRSPSAAPYWLASLRRPVPCLAFSTQTRPSARTASSWRRSSRAISGCSSTPR